MMSRKINSDNFSLAELSTYQVGVLQASAHRALKKQGDKLLKEYGITNMQWHIIGTVLDTGEDGARISDLARELDTTMAFLTNNVNLLEAKGILIRTLSKTDGRSSLVKVSKKFAAICPEIETSLRNELRKSIYSRLTPEELHTYIKALIKFNDID